MPSNVQTELLNAARGGSVEDMARLRSQMEQLTFVASQQVSSLRDNTDAVSQNTNTKSTGSQAAGTAKNLASTLGIGMFLSPLITGISKLFGGGKKEETLPVLTPVVRPAALNFDAAISSNAPGRLTNYDYSQDGSPRPVISQPQVTIQIQALDSQSLMDRSDDLARAVRQAMLQSSGLNDVISEL